MRQFGAALSFLFVGLSLVLGRALAVLVMVGVVTAIALVIRVARPRGVGLDGPDVALPGVHCRRLILLLVHSAGPCCARASLGNLELRVAHMASTLVALRVLHVAVGKVAKHRHLLLDFLLPLPLLLLEFLLLLRVEHVEVEEVRFEVPVSVAALRWTTVVLRLRRQDDSISLVEVF